MFLFGRRIDDLSATVEHIEIQASVCHGHRVIHAKMKKRSGEDSWQADRIIQIRASTEPRGYASTRVPLYVYARVRTYIGRR